MGHGSSLNHYPGLLLMLLFLIIPGQHVTCRLAYQRARCLRVLCMADVTELNIFFLSIELLNFYCILIDVYELNSPMHLFCCLEILFLKKEAYCEISNVNSRHRFFIMPHSENNHFLVKIRPPPPT